MQNQSQYSLQSAREAAAHDQLGEWVARFLASPGSDNPALAQQLTAELHWWAGPVLLPIDRLQRLAGPAGDPVLCVVDDDYWDERVESMDQLAEEGWDPPPVVVACRESKFELEDGNHRVESVRRAGRREAWAIVGFTRELDRDTFAHSHIASWEEGDRV
jgi:hypothetical protein